MQAQNCRQADRLCQGKQRAAWVKHLQASQMFCSYTDA